MWTGDIKILNSDGAVVMTGSRDAWTLSSGQVLRCSYAEVLGRLSPVPAQAGVYGL
jgi:hypothetical protein